MTLPHRAKPPRGLRSGFVFVLCEPTFPQVRRSLWFSRRENQRDLAFVYQEGRDYCAFTSTLNRVFSHSRTRSALLPSFLSKEIVNCSTGC